MSILIILATIVFVFILIQNKILCSKIDNMSNVISDLENSLIDKDNVKIEEDFQERVYIVSYKNFIRYIPMDND